MYGFRGNGMYGLGDTCSDLAASWVADMQQCQATGISNTNPACIAQNTAFAQGGANGCDPALFIATQVAAANPTATVQQVATVVQQQVPTATAAQAQAAAAVVVQNNPTATPIIVTGSPIISVSSSGAVSSSPASATTTASGAPAVLTPSGNVVPISAATGPSAANQLANAMAPAGTPAAGSDFCLFGDTSASIGGIPACGNTLMGIAAALVLVLLLKR